MAVPFVDFKRHVAALRPEIESTWPVVSSRRSHTGVKRLE